MYYIVVRDCRSMVTLCSLVEVDFGHCRQSLPHVREEMQTHTDMLHTPLCQSIPSTIPPHAHWTCNQLLDKSSKQSLHPLFEFLAERLETTTSLWCFHLVVSLTLRSHYFPKDEVI